MTTALKAALLSALVFPGCGHLLLKSYLRALLLIGVTLLSLGSILAALMQRTQIIADKIVSGEIAPDPVVITKLAEEAARDAMSGATTLALWALLVCWIIGIADSYRLGRRVDLG